jgi:hypothetical protein
MLTRTINVPPSRSGHPAGSPNTPMPSVAPTKGSMLMKTLALALSTRVAPYCYAAVARKVESSPCPKIAAHADVLNSSGGGLWRNNAIGNIVAVATTSVTAGMAMADRVTGTRFRTKRER